MSNTQEEIKTRYIPITKWPEYHPYPTVSGMRYLRFHQEELGYSSAFLKLNKRILVDEQEFFRILRSQQTDLINNKEIINGK
jgi:hypothetical protein